MYVNRTAVTGGGTRYVYLRLVEAYRDGGKVRHRLVAHLGREDGPKALGQLEEVGAGSAPLELPPGCGRGVRGRRQGPPSAGAQRRRRGRAESVGATGAAGRRLRPAGPAAV